MALADNEQIQQEAAAFREDLQKIRQEVGRVMVGQQHVVEGAIVALFCGGNLLLEGVPGLGKTMLIKTLGAVLDLDFSRIQFTPDLMPADIIGTNVMNTDAHGRYEFEFRQGPIFTQLLLADEINRATPKTQSALLEAMQELSVTSGTETYKLKRPFLVMATQNPLEQEGTYPLPEAQLDRFMFKIDVPFINRDELNEVVSRTILRPEIEINKVMDGERILALRKVLDKVVVADPIRDYACRLVLATHPDTEFATDGVRKFIRWGASPRAAQALIRAGRVRSLAEGRAHLAFEDVRHFAVEVLQHRMLLNYDGQAENASVPELIQEALTKVPEQAD